MLFVFFISSLWGTRAEVLQFNGTLSHGTFNLYNPKTIDLFEKSYTLNLVYCDHSSQANIRINDQRIAKLHPSETYELDSDYFIRVYSVTYQNAGGYENCDVQLSIFSNHIICGDNICSTSETCRSDACCDGKETNWGAACCNGNVVDVGHDTKNCGTCGNTCNESQYCTGGQCINSCGDGYCVPLEREVCALDCPWCGDGICNAEETYKSCLNDCPKPSVCGDRICDEKENCCQDCSCREKFQCLRNFCVPVLKCYSNSDCDVNETCVDENCTVEVIEIEKNNLSGSIDFPATQSQPAQEEETTNTSVVQNVEQDNSIFKLIKMWLLNLVGWKSWGG